MSVPEGTSTFVTTLITKRQLCEWWGVQPSCICKWVKQGLPEIELTDKLRFYDVSEVEKFVRTYNSRK